MRIAFLGDTSSVNALSWIDALRRIGGCDVEARSLAGGAAARGRQALSWLPALPATKLWLARSRPDILVAYRTTSYGFLAAATGFHPLVVAAQGETDVWPPDSLLAPLKARLARFCVQRADLVHAWATHMTRSLVELGATRAQLMVLPRGVDIERFRPPGPGERQGAARVIATRSLASIYRHDVLIRAVAALRSRGVTLHVDFAGDGPEREALRALAGELRVSEFVTFHGRVPHEKLPALLQGATLYVSMPSSEGLSASLVEAMATGCFPIVSDLPANREWVTDSENGIVLPSHDPELLAEALSTSLSRVDWRQRATEANRRLACDRGSAALNIARFVAAYRALVAAKSP